jgi:hypothetical protein
MPHFPAQLLGVGHSTEDGNRYWMVNVSAFDFPPRGAGFFTTIDAVPVDATAIEGT